MAIIVQIRNSYISNIVSDFYTDFFLIQTVQKVQEFLLLVLHATIIKI